MSLAELACRPARPACAAGHHPPQELSDGIALFITRCLRLVADLFFAKRYGHRAVVLETVAAVPGMVGATLTHLRCLRHMVDDDGWIRTLMDEAEDERMPNLPAPAVARDYWKLHDSARLADVVRAVRADEARHRDVNHGLASALASA